MLVEIISEVDQNDGRKSIQASYTTNLGDVVSKSFLVPTTLISIDYATNKESDVLTQLKQVEMHQLENEINSGVASITSIAQNLKYLTLNEALYSVIERGITLTNVYRLINLKTITEYTEINFTNEELATTTGFDVSLVELYYSRVATALTCVDSINSLKASAYNG